MAPAYAALSHGFTLFPYGSANAYEHHAVDIVSIHSSPRAANRVVIDGMSFDGDLSDKHNPIEDEAGAYLSFRAANKYIFEDSPDYNRLYLDWDLSDEPGIIKESWKGWVKHEGSMLDIMCSRNDKDSLSQRTWVEYQELQESEKENTDEEDDNDDDDDDDDKINILEEPGNQTAKTQKRSLSNHESVIIDTTEEEQRATKRIKR